MTKVFSLALALSLCASAAMAETCHSRATDKNLHGAALTSFMKKCVRETGSTCSMMAADKKLHGAAKTSFENKCLRDNIGN
jgi:hypothetical protein